VVLGSTGSIGVNALQVIEHLTRTAAQPFEVVGLAAGRNAKLLSQQLALHPGAAAATACARVPAGLEDRRTFTGDDAARQLVEHCRHDVVVSAIVGIAGLPATLAAVEQGCTVALANKETLVAAGALVMSRARRCGATLIPVDSEHSAIFQCLAGKPDTAAVQRVVLTASGGPFRDTPLEKIQNATAEEALRHPTWDMGPKISIDSATMMNKALEIIEAHHLFNLPAEKIEALIHPQSVVHSFVEFADHSVLAQLGPPDMRTPIQVALTHPDRRAGVSDRLDWNKLRQLDFYPPDGERFPALPLAYECLRAQAAGSMSAGAVLNAANEAAVKAFLEHRIRFGRIVELVTAALRGVPDRPITSLEDVLEADRTARGFVDAQIASEPAVGR
jgi:1-deoxy-D-xylulose-5-phosphate reductoisomerase